MHGVLAGRYGLIERIGEGATGVVWLAHDQKLERDVAVKLLRPLVASDSEQRQRFAREAQVLAQLSNDHIVRVFDYLDDGEQALLVMEHVDGLNLAETTAGRLPIRVGEAATYLAPVASALAYAHAEGVIHRDLTPSNVLIESRTGRVVTTDFGLARLARMPSTLTGTGTLIGTPEYWSPEQAGGRSSVAATDVYALGCMLFLLLSGRLPFEGDDRLACGLRRAHEAAPSLRERLPDASPELVAFVDSLLARDPGGRPSAQAAAAFLAGLSRSAPPVVEGERLGAPERRTMALSAEGPTVAMSSPSRRRPRRRALLGAVVVSAAVTFGGFFLVHALSGSMLRVPRLVSLRESDARQRIRRALPGALVEVTSRYSLRAPAGRVLRQKPGAGQRVADGSPIRLVVSKGTPFADVPDVAAGAAPNAARSVLTEDGFKVRYRWAPSWHIRKGTVIEVLPRAGTRLRRPAHVKVMISSGYPRSVVPNVQSTDLTTAQARLLAKHLRYSVVYRVERGVAPNQVVDQAPAAGASVYQGTHVQLTVARTQRWVQVLRETGTGSYVSEPFTVPAHWRIRYRVIPGWLGAGVAQISWAPDTALDGGHDFLATATAGLETRTVSDGPGTYRLAVEPYAGIHWYVEVDALR
jgi:eukaryotic-like serine/threonine-protein kinase